MEVDVTLVCMVGDEVGVGSGVEVGVSPRSVQVYVGVDASSAANSKAAVSSAERDSNDRQRAITMMLMRIVHSRLRKFSEPWVIIDPLSDPLGSHNTG